MIWFINYSTIITLCMIFIISDCIRTFAMVENQVSSFSTCHFSSATCCFNIRIILVLFTDVFYRRIYSFSSF
ncbi:hypothetical protein GLOIN_2v1574618, partial [Rhizophagus irregularis DAOM 181602=DAOM 197198]